MLKNLLLGGVSRLALFAPETGGGESAPADFTPSLPPDTGPINVDAAAKAISEQRAKQAAPAEQKPAAPRAPDGKFAAAPTESTLEGDDAGPETVPGENAEADPAEAPPIEPPRSWSKEDKELFNSLPRETQERVADRERSRESDFLRRQNEAADKSKALEAKEQAADQARTQYEQAAQNALSILHTQQAAEFGDIKTDADVMKLATEDPFRFSQWQARQMQIQRQTQEVQQLNQQRERDEQEQFKTWSKEQDDKFSKRFPEFNDPEKGPKVRASVTSYLTKEVGVPEDVLPKLWNNPLFRDEMFQRVIYEASRFHEAQQRAKSAVQAPKPPVQRPGVAPQKGSQLQDEIAAAATRLSNSKGIEAARAAADLMAMRRRAARR